ncbi:MAG: hypothetical protein ACOYU3_07300 [Bacillota bacterium]
MEKGKKKGLYWLIGAAVIVILIAGGIVLANSTATTAFSDGYEAGYNAGKLSVQNTGILSVSELNACIDYLKKVSSQSEYNPLREKVGRTIVHMFPDIPSGEISKYLTLHANKKTDKYPVEYFENLGYTYTSNDNPTPIG